MTEGSDEIFLAYYTKNGNLHELVKKINHFSRFDRIFKKYFEGIKESLKQINF
jgi:hypothetical protein